MLIYPVYKAKPVLIDYFPSRFGRRIQLVLNTNQAI